MSSRPSMKSPTDFRFHNFLGSVPCRQALGQDPGPSRHEVLMILNNCCGSLLRLGSELLERDWRIVGNGAFSLLLDLPVDRLSDDLLLLGLDDGRSLAQHCKI